MPKSYKECSRGYIHYSDYILMPLVCRHKYDPEISCYLRISQVMLSKAGEKSLVLNHLLNSLTSGKMKISGSDLAKDRLLLFDQRWHDILLTSSPCYARREGAREKNPPSPFNGFHLYRLGVTTSNILEILA